MRNNVSKALVDSLLNNGAFDYSAVNRNKLFGTIGIGKRGVSDVSGDAEGRHVRINFY